MPHIDDPIEQTQGQFSDEDPILGPILTIAAGVAALHPAGAPIALALTTANAVRDFFSRQAIDLRFSTLVHAISATLRPSVTAAKVEEQMQNPAAKEAVIAAAWQAIRTADDQKIRRFGTVIGSTLGDDAPDWERAAELVGDLERLNDRDLATLHLIWSVQHDQEAEPGRMHTDSNRYTGQWNRVLGFAVSRLHLNHDELYSRCGRLTGFGLALEVQRNGSHQGPGDHCFRLTGKAVQLLRTLGAKPDDLPFPDIKVEFLGGNR